MQDLRSTDVCPGFTLMLWEGTKLMVRESNLQLISVLCCLPAPWLHSYLHLERHSGKVTSKHHQFPSAQFFWMSLLEGFLCCLMPQSRKFNLSAPANLPRSTIHRHFCWGHGIIIIILSEFRPFGILNSLSLYLILNRMPTCCNALFNQ